MNLLNDYVNTLIYKTGQVKPYHAGLGENSHKVKAVIIFQACMELLMCQAMLGLCI